MKVLAHSAALSLIFLSNLHEIERHNAQVNRTYTKTVNQFSDLTQSEFETGILTPQLAFAPIPNPPPTSVQTRSSSSNPNACCSALGLGDGNRPQCSYDGNPSECCAALDFAWRGGRGDLLPNGYPKDFDWTSMTYRTVTNAKNQGRCGTCTFFAVAAALESAYAIRHERDAVPLSEQQLIECSIP
ncbi:unnamed protein product [Adineta ricciae]|uniref:Peptidase C1A papain C-terminal domain-containing protein n=1 Tax=Adineta ricciae TaxID=249248 RepID=A0A815EMR6_ADIRI|nr:unnamed protein product [Adineta ricciae]CAF1308549.1 unnamed protein product [Adineta ricciae]